MRKEYNMDTEKKIKFGFVKDVNNSKLKEILKDNARLKTIHIDIYADNPLKPSKHFMLLLRAYENNVVVLNDGNRFDLIKNDRFKTCLMSILFSKITECHYEINENYSEFIVNIQNIYYRLSILN